MTRLLILFRAMTPRRWRGVVAVFAALTMNYGPFAATAVRAGTFDDVIQVMQTIDSVAPGALPFSANELIAYRTMLIQCGSASGADDVLACVEAAASSGAGQEAGIPSWLPQMIAVYFDIEHHDYWGLLADAGEAVACAAAELLTGVDVCEAIQTIIDAGKDIAKGAVAVADAVEEFFSDLGSGLEDLGCDIASLFGGCDDSPPPPPTAMDTANSVCGPRGGVASMSSASNAANDLALKCNDGTVCRIKPNQTPQCETPEARAAAEKQKQTQNSVDFATRPQQWATQFEAKWIPQCLDDQCRLGVRFAKTGMLALAQQRHAADPDYPWAFMGLDLQKADQQAQQMIGESQQRNNDAAFANGNKQWAVQFEAKWLPQCLDDQCKTGIKFLREGTVLHVQQVHQADPKLPYSLFTADYQQADQKAQQIVNEAQQRFNAKTTAGAAQGWDQLAVAVWSKQCADAPCVQEVTVLGEQMRQAAIQRQAQEPNQSSLHVQGEVNQQYGPMFKAAVDRSIQRRKAPHPLQQNQ